MEIGATSSQNVMKWSLLLPIQFLFITFLNLNNQKLVIEKLLMICRKEIEPWTMATNANKLSTLFMIAFHCCWWRNKLSAFTLAFIKRFIKTVPVYVHMLTSYLDNEFVFLRPPLVRWAFSSWKWLHYSNWILGRKKHNLQMQQRLLAERTAGQGLWCDNRKLDHESTNLWR